MNFYNYQQINYSFHLNPNKTLITDKIFSLNQGSRQSGQVKFGSNSTIFINYAPIGYISLNCSQVGSSPHPKISLSLQISFSISLLHTYISINKLSAFPGSFAWLYQDKMGRSPCCEKEGLKKGPWTPEEDQKLLAYIEEYGHGSWRALPTKAGNSSHTCHSFFLPLDLSYLLLLYSSLLFPKFPHISFRVPIRDSSLLDC